MSAPITPIHVRGTATLSNLALPASPPAESLPNPAYGVEVDELRFYKPTAMMVRIRTEDEEICACCHCEIADGGCAVAFYVDPQYGRGPTFERIFHMLCPWCADLPDRELAAAVLTFFRKTLMEAQEKVTESLESNARGESLVWDLESAVMAVREAMVLASSFEALWLRPGETWTPTSHPTKHEQQKAGDSNVR